MFCHVLAESPKPELYSKAQDVTSATSKSQGERMIQPSLGRHVILCIIVFVFALDVGNMIH